MLESAFFVALCGQGIGTLSGKRTICEIGQFLSGFWYTAVSLRWDCHTHAFAVHSRRFMGPTATIIDPITYE